MHNVAAWLRGFRPAPVNAGRRERLYASLGAWVGLFFTGLLSKTMLGDLNPWFIAPMGASAVLLFAVPSSPLAQPWSLIGGNIISALIGVTCAKCIPDPMLAASLAASLAIAAMFAMHCLHPPSGAVALTAVLGGPAVLASGYKFVFWPVGLNSIFLLVAALLFNNLLRRRYPHVHVPHVNPHLTADPLPTERLGVTRADLDAALKGQHELIDVDPDDLEDILLHAQDHAWHRRFGYVRCSDLMSKDVVMTQASTSLTDAWKLLLKHKIKALPVVDEAGVLNGIISLHDLMLAHEPESSGHAPSPASARRVEQVMTRNVRTATAGQLVGDLVPLFSDAGYHHMPVIDEQRRVIGMVTQSDLIAALYRARVEESKRSSQKLAAPAVN